MDKPGSPASEMGSGRAGFFSYVWKKLSHESTRLSYPHILVLRCSRG